MGEAKRRKLKDPNYGSYPKVGKSLVISPPISVSESEELYVDSNNLDPVELRRWVLFWDHLAWPFEKGITIAGSAAEVGFLSEAGMLTRPEVRTNSDSSSVTEFLAGHLNYFSEKDQESPGNWAMAQGPKALSFDTNRFAEGRGTLVTLYRCIPIPEADVPLESVLEFKSKRIDELRKLRIEIDCLYTQFCNASDSEFELIRCMKIIEAECSTVVRIAKESKIPFRLSDLRPSFSANVGSISAAGAFAAKGALLGSGYGLETLGAIVGGALPFIGISKSLSFKSATAPTSPYSFVGDLHKDVL